MWILGENSVSNSTMRRVRSAFSVVVMIATVACDRSRTPSDARAQWTVSDGSDPKVDKLEFSALTLSDNLLSPADTGSRGVFMVACTPTSASLVVIVPRRRTRRGSTP